MGGGPGSAEVLILDFHVRGNDDSRREGLKSVEDYPNLVEGLLKRDYSEADIRKILGTNFLRVWQQVEDFDAGAK